MTDPTEAHRQLCALVDAQTGKSERAKCQAVGTLLNTAHSTVWRWLHGERAISGPAAKLIAIYVDQLPSTVPDSTDVAETRPANDRPRIASPTDHPA